MRDMGHVAFAATSKRKTYAGKMGQILPQGLFTVFSRIPFTSESFIAAILLPNENIGNLVVQKEGGDPIRRML